MASHSTKRKIAAAVLAAVPASLAAAGALVYWRYRRDLRAAESRISTGSRLISTPYGPIEYADAGEYAEARMGTPVLVIHGAGGGFDQGMEFGQPLIEHGYRVIAPSRFGYLRTPLPGDASPMAQADAHAYLLDALHLEKVAVIGISAGAPSAMQLCLRHPARCKALVLTVPLAYSARPEGASAKEATFKEPGALKEFLLDAMLSSNFAFWSMTKLARNAMIKTVLGTPPKDLVEAGEEEMTRLTEFLSHIQPISRRKKGLLNEAAIARSLPRYDLERLQVPTLVIGVENCLYNTYAGARYTAENVPGARLCCWATGGHLAVGHLKELWAEVENFLQTTAASEQREKQPLAANYRK